MECLVERAEGHYEQTYDESSFKKGEDCSQELVQPAKHHESEYTFQSLSYTVDVYRGRVEVQRNPVSFGAYVTLFPQLIAGPIVRYVDVARELNHRTHSWDGFAKGLRGKEQAGGAEVIATLILLIIGYRRKNSNSN